MLPCVGEFILQIGNGGGVSACGHWHTAAPRLCRLAVPRSCWFTAYGATPCLLTTPGDDDRNLPHDAAYCASQQIWMPIDRSGSLATEELEVTRSSMSALPPKADSSRTSRHPTSAVIAAVRGTRFMECRRRSLRLDACGLDDRPPFLDVDFLQRR